ncbi:MAG: hypothetical protein KBS81_01185, partial [Spirochaetales bacterium]|nr:hypothetical protein [Candidatus Physcosoma equi]
STELGLVCKGGAAVQTTENMKVCVSAGLSDMFYSTAVSNIYGNASGNVGMIGMNAQVECSYSF